MEVGGWNTLRIADFCSVIRGASPRPKGDKRFYNGPVPRLMVEDVTRDGKYVMPEVDSLTEKGAAMSRLMKAGGLTVVCSATTVGVPSFLKVDACIHDGFLGLVSFKKNVSQDFVYYQLDALRQKIDAAATHGGTFTNLTVNGFGSIQIDIPNDLCEQRRISEVLSDADALISSLEKLIEKKQNVLFEFHNHLFGNTPISDEVTLNSLGHFYGGLSGKTAADFGVGLSSFVTFKSVIDYHEVNVADVGRVHISRLESQNLVKKGDLLFNISSETPDEVAQFSLVPFEKSNLYLNSFCAGFRCHNNHYDFAKMLNYLLKTNPIRNRITQLAQGSTRYNISPRLLGSVKVPIFDQSRIAMIVNSLDDFYAEIKIVSENLLKAKKVKAGMMQELLTGKTRLI